MVRPISSAEGCGTLGRTHRVPPTKKEGKKKLDVFRSPPPIRKTTCNRNAIILFPKPLLPTLPFHRPRPRSPSWRAKTFAPRLRLTWTFAGPWRGAKATVRICEGANVGVVRHSRRRRGQGTRWSRPTSLNEGDVHRSSRVGGGERENNNTLCVVLVCTRAQKTHACVNRSKNLSSLMRHPKFCAQLFLGGEIPIKRTLEGSHKALLSVVLVPGHVIMLSYFNTY